MLTLKPLNVTIHPNYMKQKKYLNSLVASQYHIFCDRLSVLNTVCNTVIHFHCIIMLTV